MNKTSNIQHRTPNIEAESKRKLLERGGTLTELTGWTGLM
jgi:hypothetical protein